MAEIIYSGFYGSWGYYDSAGKFVKTTSSGSPLSTTTTTTQPVSQVTDPWASQAVPGSQVYQQYVAPQPPPPQEPEPFGIRGAGEFVTESARDKPYLAVGEESVVILPGGAEIHEKYEYKPPQGVYRAPMPGESPISTELIIPGGTQFSLYTAARTLGIPQYFETVYEREEMGIKPKTTTLGTKTKLRETFGELEEKYSFIYEHPAYKVGEIVGGMYFISGGGGFGYLDPMAFEIYEPEVTGSISAQFQERPGKYIGASEIRTKTGRIIEPAGMETYKLDIKPTEQMDVYAFTRKGKFTPAEGNIILRSEISGLIDKNIIRGAGKVFGGGEERLIQQFSMNIAQFEKGAFGKGITLGEGIYRGGGVVYEMPQGFRGDLFKAIRNDYVNLISQAYQERTFGQVLGKPPSTQYVQLSNMLSGVRSEVSVFGAKETMKGLLSKQLVDSKLAFEWIGYKTTTKVRQKTTKQVQVSMARLDEKVSSRMRAATQMRTEETRRATGAVSTSAMAQRRETRQAVTSMQTQRERQDMMRMTGQVRGMREMTEQIMTPITPSITTVPPPTVPPRLPPPRPPFWPMRTVAPRGRKIPLDLPKAKRGYRYTPSLTAWAGDIKRKLSRAERKRMFTGLEVRPIPLDEPIRKKRRKGRGRR